jgi:molecular chaperone DnaK (HSP70)
VAVKAVKDAGGLSLKEIDEIIMVGGSTRVPLGNEMVENILALWLTCPC